MSTSDKKNQIICILYRSLLDGLIKHQTKKVYMAFIFINYERKGLEKGFYENSENILKMHTNSNQICNLCSLDKQLYVVADMLPQGRR